MISRLPSGILKKLNVGILFIFAVAGLEVYGVIMGGWASNSKYPFLGSLRSAAQMISWSNALGTTAMSAGSTCSCLPFHAVRNR